MLNVGLCSFLDCPEDMVQIFVLLAYAEFKHVLDLSFRKHSDSGNVIFLISP